MKKGLLILNIIVLSVLSFIYLSLQSQTFAENNLKIEKQISTPHVKPDPDHKITSKALMTIPPVVRPEPDFKHKDKMHKTQSNKVSEKNIYKQQHAFKQPPQKILLKSKVYNNVSRINGYKTNSIGSITYDQSSSLLGSISGNVTKETGGQPIAGLQVWAVDLYSNYGYGSETQTDGSYIIMDLPTGSYMLFVETSGTDYIAEAYVNANAYDYQSITAVSVVAGVNVTNIDFQLATGGGKISGVVTNKATGLPIAGLSITVLEPDSGGWLNSAVTQPDGSYTITGLPARNYLVYADTYDTEYVYAYYNNTRNYDNATAVTVALGSTTSDINFNLSVGGSISGVVIRDGDNQPVAGLTMWAIEIRDTSEWWLSNATTQSDGSYTLKGLASGNYIVRFVNYGESDYIEEYYNNAVKQDNAISVSVTEGVVSNNINFSLAVGGSISGVVKRDSDNQPIGDLQVEAYNAILGNWYSSETKADGTYIIKGLPVGSYRVEVSTYDTDYISEYFNNTINSNDATPVSVSVGAITPNINFSLAVGGSISGVVKRDSDNQPIGDLQVEAYNAILGNWYSSETEADGTYIIKGLPVGSYRVEVITRYTEYAGEYYDNTYNRDNAKAILVSSGVTTFNIDFNLAVAGSISGIVKRDSDNQPIAGLRVYIVNFDNDHYAADAYTQADGSYTIKGLSPGNYRVRALTDETDYIEEYYNNTTNSDNATPVSVSVGATTPNINFSLAVGGTISGIVKRDLDNQAIIGLEVNACNSTLGNCYWAETQSDGSYIIKGLLSGDYLVEVRAYDTEYISEYYNNTINYDNATLVAVTLGSKTANIDFSLATGGTISGIVKSDLDNQAISGLQVNAYDPKTGLGLNAQTKSDGTYTIIGLPAGNYRVQVSTYDTGYIEEYYNNTINYDNATLVEVALGANTANIDFSLALGGSISGIVKRDIDNQLIAGLQVRAYDSNIGWNESATTKADGSYTIIGLPTGNYKVNVYTNGTDYISEYYNNTRNYNEATPVPVTAGINTPNIDFGLILGGSISGQVKRDYDNQPIEDVQVYAQDYLTGVQGGSAWTESDGSYKIRGLFAGNYRVKAQNNVDYVDEYYNNTYVYNNATQVVVAFGAETQNIGFSLAPSQPEATIISGPAQGEFVISSSIDFGWSGIGGAGGTFTFSYKLDNGAWSSFDLGQTHTFTGLSEGTHTLYVKAKDQAGNEDPTPVSRSFIVDTIPPDTSITTGPANNSYIASINVTFIWKGTETTSPPVSYSYKIDNNEWSSFDTATSQTFNALSEGQHTFTVKAKDQAGNEDQTPASRTFTVDITAPDTTITSGPAEGSNISSTSVTFGWSGSDSGSGVASYSYTMDDNAWSAFSNTKTQTFSGLSEGQHIFYVKAKDNVGNENSTPVLVHFNILPLPDLIVVSVAAPPKAWSGQNVVIEWTVKNIGTDSTQAVGWSDRVYLSIDQTADASDSWQQLVQNASYLQPSESYVSSGTFKVPNAIAGTYYVIIETDASNNINEKNNQNNTNYTVIPIELTPPPDLQVSLVSAPEYGWSELPILISWTVENKGVGEVPADQSSWSDSIYLSSDTIFNSSNDILLGTFSHTGVLAAGGTYSMQNKNVNLPAGRAGDYYVFVVTDSGNHVYEHASEDNNARCDATPVHITLTPPPDLVVSSVDAPASGTAGHKVTVSWSVKNQGAGETAPGLWVDAIYLSNDTIFDSTTDTLLTEVLHSAVLGAGQSYTQSTEVSLPHCISGSYYIFIVTDNGKTVFEYDSSQDADANNTGVDSNPIQISKTPPDLQVSSVSIPSYGGTGLSINVTWTIANAGTGDTVVENWFDRIYLCASPAFNQNSAILLEDVIHNGALSAGGTYTQNREVTIPVVSEGAYYVYVQTDSDNVVSECSGENNNIFRSAEPIDLSLTQPDLQVASVDAPSSADSGGSIVINWDVSNSGTAPTKNISWHDSVYLSADSVLDKTSDTLLGTFEHSGLVNAGSSYQSTLTARMPHNISGAYSIFVCTDTDEKVFEGQNEANNCSPDTNPINVVLSAAPDLQISSVTVPPTGYSGQDISVSWAVENSGNGETVAAAWTDYLYLSSDTTLDALDHQLGFQRHAGALAGLSSYQTTAQFELPRDIFGQYYIIVYMDKNNEVYEINEDNNRAYGLNPIEIAQQPPSDLIVTSVNAPAQGISGQDTTISWTVENDGLNPAFGSWLDSIYLSTDTTWDIDDTLVSRVEHSGQLDPNQEYTDSITANLPGVKPGVYYVIVRADIRNNVRETDEANNMMVSTATISIDAIELQLGTPYTSQLSTGAQHYYKVNVTEGEDLHIMLDSQSEESNNELFVAYNQIPDRINYDYAYRKPFEPDQEVMIPSIKVGWYYILVRADKVPDAPAVYTITASLPVFSISSVSPGRAGNKGKSTFNLTGVKFEDNMTATLSYEGGLGTTAFTGNVLGSLTAFYTFDLNAVSPGKYDLKLQKKNGQEAQLNSAVEIVAGKGGSLDIQLLVPENVRPGSVSQLWLVYQNRGDSDIAIPVVTVLASGGSLNIPEYTNGTSGMVRVYNPGYTGFGVLPPGESVSIPIKFNAPSTNMVVNFSVEALPIDDTAFDWSAIELDVKNRTNMTDEEWQRGIGNIGNTWADILYVLSKYSRVGSSLFDDQILYAVLLYSTFENYDNQLSSYHAKIGINPAIVKSEVGGLETTGCLTPNENNVIVTVESVFNGLPLIDKTKKTIVITHGQGGMWDSNGDRKERFKGLVNAITECNNYNVVTINWSDSSQCNNPTNTAEHIDDVAKMAKGQLEQRGLTDFSNVLYIGESFGNAVNARISEESKNPGDALIFNPAAEGGFSLWNIFSDNHAGVPNYEKSFNESIASKTDAIWDTGKLQVGKHDIHLGCYYQEGTYNDCAYEVGKSKLCEGTPTEWHTSGLYWLLKQLEDDDKCNNPWLTGEINIPETPKGYTNAVHCNGSFYSLVEITEDDLIGLEVKGKLVYQTSSRVVAPRDPNDKIGPVGKGEERFIGSASTMPYTINFENVATATGPASRIVINDTLDPSFDARTLRLTEIVFGDHIIPVLENRSYYQTRVELGSDHGNILADINAGIDITTNKVFWSLMAIDPATGEQPENPLLGLLPLNDENHSGEGHVCFTIKPKEGLPQGTKIKNTAAIVFDQNEPINTNEVSNTIGEPSPTSTTTSAGTTPATTTTSSSSSSSSSGGGGGAGGTVTSTTTTAEIPDWTTTSSSSTSVKSSTTTSVEPPIAVITTTTSSVPENSCPIIQTLGEGRPELNVLRTFRDKKLTRSATGLSLTYLYYTHSQEISNILASNPDFKAKARELVLEMLPVIKNIDTLVKLTDAQKQKIVFFMKAVQTKASPQLSASINYILEKLNSGELMKEIR